MNGEVLQRKVTVTDPLGFHLRPLAAFAQRAKQFQSSVAVTKGAQRVNGKSPLELMLLAAEQGVPVLAEMLASPGIEEPPEEAIPPKG
jgi:phosphotransferase system HPr (HPr) family protein